MELSRQIKILTANLENFTLQNNLKGSTEEKSFLKGGIFK